MQIGYKSANKLDSEGRPAGGYVSGTGFTITWQDGPLGKIGTPERVEPNGAFVEDVIAAAIQRIDHYQDNGFACVENSDALIQLRAALNRLNDRTNRRVLAQTEGTHEGS